VAANGGTRHAQALGRRPDAVVGDLDSADRAWIEPLGAEGVAVVVHPAAKDYTDLDAAVAYAIEQGADEVVLVGALGDRWDHALANLLLPAQLDLGAVRVSLLDGDQEMVWVRPGPPLEVPGAVGDLVSLLPLLGDAHGVTLHGMAYPLAGETLPMGTTRGISNVIVSAPATVEVAEGLLLAVVTRGERELRGGEG
jgi:thiamine pyrophosphokinase